MNKEHLLGEIVGAIINRPNSCEVKLSEAGQITDEAIQNINMIYPSVMVDNYVIMPNHAHMILIIESGRLIIAPTVSRIIKQF